MKTAHMVLESVPCDSHYISYVWRGSDYLSSHRVPKTVNPKIRHNNKPDIMQKWIDYSIAKFEVKGMIRLSWESSSDNPMIFLRGILLR